MIRFYAPLIGDDEAHDAVVPRQKDRSSGDPVDADPVVRAEPTDVTAPG